MNMFGVKLNKPQGVNFAAMAFWGIVGGLVSTLVLLPLFGGGWKHVIALMASTAIAGLTATCGASFDKAGMRGQLLTVAIATVGYGLIATLL